MVPLYKKKIIVFYLVNYIFKNYNIINVTKYGEVFTFTNVQPK